MALALLASAAADPVANTVSDPAPSPAPASSSACLTFTPDDKGYNVTNACSSCMTALVKWCDGDFQQFDVLGKKAVRVPFCSGYQNLVTEYQCKRHYSGQSGG